MLEQNGVDRPNIVVQLGHIGALHNGVWCTEVTGTPSVIDVLPLVMAHSCRKEQPFFHRCPNKPPDVGGVGK